MSTAGLGSVRIVGCLNLLKEYLVFGIRFFGFRGSERSRCNCFLCGNVSLAAGVLGDSLCPLADSVFSKLARQ